VVLFVEGDTVDVSVQIDEVVYKLESFDVAQGIRFAPPMRKNGIKYLDIPTAITTGEHHILLTANGEKYKDNQFEVLCISRPISLGR
jgi:hypothetical protein